MLKKCPRCNSSFVDQDANYYLHLQEEILSILCIMVVGIGDLKVVMEKMEDFVACVREEREALATRREVQEGEDLEDLEDEEELLQEHEDREEILKSSIDSIINLLKSTKEGKKK